jgi:hypothetical protein
MRKTARSITDVFVDLNNIKKWDESHGDTWDPFWADDDNLYAFNCDGRGFGAQPRNLAFHKLQGNDANTLSGTLVNSMDEYGVSNQHGPDNATWKALGQECIDSVFYAFVSRHTYGYESGDPLLRQTAVNASLIKSTDKGLTWTRSAAENYSSPMWPGSRFGGPFFVHYGKNGGQVTNDNATEYVYAISPNGFWNGGDDYIIGRVLRSKIRDLNASDWTYLKGGDGEDSTNWDSQLTNAAPILSLPAKCGTTPACYIPALGRYLMVVWYIPTTLTSWFNPTEVKYDFYQAEHPWGTWTFIKSLSDNFLANTGHMYGPSLCAKFQQTQGSDVKMSLFTSGCPFDDVPTGLYKMWEIPIVLKTSPVPSATMINDDDSMIVYTGNWTSSPGRKFFDYNDDLHYSTTINDTAEIPFTGTGIDYIAEKDSSHGNVDVYLDGAFKQNVNLSLTNFPKMAQVVVYSITGLPSGSHTLKIVNKSTGYAVVDAFRIYK